MFMQQLSMIATMVIFVIRPLFSLKKWDLFENPDQSNPKIVFISTCLTASITYLAASSSSSSLLHAAFFTALKSLSAAAYTASYLEAALCSQSHTRQEPARDP